jgi:hypothetical protein
MKTLKVEITKIESYFSQSYGCYIDDGYEANALNPEDFDCDQLYSRIEDTEIDALKDILKQIGEEVFVEIQ